MPAYEGEDHWIWFTEEAQLHPNEFQAATMVIRAERMIRNLGRNLAIAGALEHAFRAGFNNAYWDGATWEPGQGFPNAAFSVVQG